jgi:hypothetical protein
VPLAAVDLRSSAHRYYVPSDHPHLPPEDRLQMLKRLHEQGLITDEEYRSKKQQILRSVVNEPVSRFFSQLPTEAILRGR